MAKTYSFDALGLLHGSHGESLYNNHHPRKRGVDVPISFVSALGKKKEGFQYLSAYRPVF